MAEKTQESCPQDLDTITPQWLENPYESMPNCMAAVVEANRGHCKYLSICIHKTCFNLVNELIYLLRVSIVFS